MVDFAYCQGPVRYDHQEGEPTYNISRSLEKFFSMKNPDKDV